jgi:hypothetical protein
MLEPVAPVRQRHVVVDPDEIDLRIGPERVEVEEHVARLPSPGWCPKYSDQSAA